MSHRARDQILAVVVDFSAQIGGVMQVLVYAPQAVRDVSGVRDGIPVGNEYELSIPIWSMRMSCDSSFTGRRVTPKPRLWMYLWAVVTQ